MNRRLKQVVQAMAMSTVALSSAHAQWSSHWTLQGEMGLARASGQQGLAVTVVPAWQWRRLMVANTGEAIVGGMSGHVLLFGDDNLQCGNRQNGAPRSGGGQASSRCYKPSRWWLGDIVEGTYAAGMDSLVSMGVGYRFGPGRGPVGVLKLTKRVGNAQGVFLRTHVGAHYLAIRVGARILP